MNSTNFLLSLLGVVFITLKLCNVITWSWWLVLLPLYGGWALLGVIWFIVFVATYFIRK